MAQRSLNKVQLIGNLTRDPELRYTPQGTAVCTLGLATNRAWKTEAGEKKEDVEFHRLVAWNKLAELCAQLLFKGRKIFAEGRLQTRQWTAQDGTPRQTTEVVINEMIILDSRRAPGDGVGGEGVGAVPAVDNQADNQADVPADTAKVEADSSAEISDDKNKKKEKKTETEEVKPEDIPF